MKNLLFLIRAYLIKKIAGNAQVVLNTKTKGIEFSNHSDIICRGNIVI